MTFLPAEPFTGIRFVRTDLPNRPTIVAVAESRQPMPLRTRLAANGGEVDMVEHVMAALYALQIDNVEIHCTAAEMPALDGSSHAIAMALQTVGTVQLEAPQPTLVVEEPLRIEGSNGEYVSIEPSTELGLTVEYHLDYGPNSPIGKCTYGCLVTPALFIKELAAARTFITRAEAEALQARGLARHVTERDLLVFDEDGPRNNQLRFADECARHKALDLIGDLALCGVHLQARVVAQRSGHQLNGRVAEALRAQWKAKNHDIGRGAA